MVRRVEIFRNAGHHAGQGGGIRRHRAADRASRDAVVLRQVARTGSRELFTLAVLAIALGLAFGSAKLFGVSYALGAFFAGMVLNESELSHKAATNSCRCRTPLPCCSLCRSA